MLRQSAGNGEKEEPETRDSRSTVGVPAETLQ